MRELVKYLLGIIIVLTIIYTIFISYNVFVFINSDESKISIEDYSESFNLVSEEREALEELFNSENLKNSSNNININYDGTPVTWVLKVEKALLEASYNELENELLRNGFISIEESDFIFLIGTNPRLEATILNARIRKSYLKNKTEIISLNNIGDLTYPYKTILNCGLYKIKYETKNNYPL